MVELPVPTLERDSLGALSWWTDRVLAALGVTIAFSERTGGASQGAYESLNLAAHVGDDPTAVDVNRLRILDALGLGSLRRALTVPEQVHGTRITRVDESNLGAGAWAGESPLPVSSCDSLFTSLRATPLLLCYADCVPVVLVAPEPAIAVAHAGWRGALGGIAGATAQVLAESAGCSTADLNAYVGPHICPFQYEVDRVVMSQFINVFGTVARADSGGLDLGAVVTRNLTDAGVASCRIAALGACTAEETERFYSYRAEAGLTGRHGALACIP